MELFECSLWTTYLLPRNMPTYGLVGGFWSLGLLINPDVKVITDEVTKYITDEFAPDIWGLIQASRFEIRTVLVINQP